MATRLRTLVLALLVLLILFLAFAWIDGGREQVRLIEQPVTLNGGAA